MKKRKTSNCKNLFVILVCLILVAGLSGCPNPLKDREILDTNTNHPSRILTGTNRSGNDQRGEGLSPEVVYGSLVITAEEAVSGSTIAPSNDLKASIDSYRVEFSNHSEGKSNFTVDPYSEGETISDIFIGDWEMTLIGRDSGGNNIASGTPDSGNPITINTGANTAVDVTLSPIDGDDNGTFIYTINFPPGDVGGVEITVDPWPIGGGDEFILTEGTDYNSDFAASGTLSIDTSLASTQYFVSVLFSKTVDGNPVDHPAICEILQIFDNLTSSKAITIESEDFTQPPDAPTGFAATPQSATEIELTWTDASNTESGFEIERAVDGGGFTDLTELTAGAASHTDMITAGSEYEYRLRSSNKFGTSTWVGPLVVPAAPTDLAAAEGTGQVELSWSDTSSNNTAYEIERSGTSGGPFNPLAPLEDDAMFYIDTSAVEGLPYYYRLRSYGGPNSSTVTEEVSGSWEPPNSPSVNGDSPTIDSTPTWSWFSGGGGNEIYRYSLDNEDLSGEPETNNTEYTPPGPLPEGEYTLFVQERDDAGNWSNNGIKTITIEIPTPSNPTPEEGAIVGVEPLLDWDDISEAAGYHIQINPDNDDFLSGTMAVDYNGLTDSQIAIDEGILATETNYFWRVKAKNEDGVWGSWNSPAWWFTTEYTVGDHGPGHGIIFYDKGSITNGWRYLEAAVYGWLDGDDDESFVWGGTGVDINGSSETLTPEFVSIGTGALNSSAIVAALENNNDVYYASQICNGIVNQGFNDWFLPSKNELDAMFNVKEIIGGFSLDFYWSSSEDGSSNAWFQDFSNGSITSNSKSGPRRVRAIRAFRSNNPSYVVTYHPNRPDSGSPPVDFKFYEPGEVVSILGNTGSLERTGFGFSFVGWNTESDGSGTHYDATGSDTFTMPDTYVILYAEWQADLGADPIGTDPGPGGGIVFYDKGSYSDGWRYLEAAPDGWYDGDDDPSFEWGGHGTDIGGDDSGSPPELTGIGYGEANAEAIITALGDNGGTAYAAQKCDQYNNNGYSDWFLPSKDELNEMYVNSGVIGGYGDSYWSSSEYSSYHAWGQYFETGAQLSNYDKDDSERVRAVRAF